MPQPNQFRNWAEFQSVVESLSKDEIYRYKDRSVEWFRTFIQSFFSNQQKLQDVFQNANFTKTRYYPQYGKMYTFLYDPETKSKLAYYDEFPLVVVLESYNDRSFLGLNLHYLDYKERLVLFEKLEMYEVVDRSSRYQNNSRMLLDYDTIKRNATRFPYYKACIKRYKEKNLRSNLIRIEQQDWLSVLFLPTERFVNKQKRYVFAESRKKKWH